MGSNVVKCCPIIDAPKGGGASFTETSFARGRATSYRSYLTHADLSPTNGKNKPKTHERVALPDIALTSPGGTVGDVIVPCHDFNENLVEEIVLVESPPKSATRQGKSPWRRQSQTSERSQRKHYYKKEPNVLEFLGLPKWISPSIAVIDGSTGRAYSLDQLRIQVIRVSGGFRRVGFNKGHILCIHAPNSPEVLIAFLAALTLGGATVIADPSWSTETVYKSIKRWRPRVVISEPGHLEAVIQAKEELDNISLFVLGSSPRCPSFRTLQDDANATLMCCRDGEADDVALHVIYGDAFSASKGRPVVITQRNIVASLRQIRDCGMLSWQTEGSRVLGAIPFMHPFGLIGVACWTLYQNSVLVTLPHWELRKVLEVNKTHNVTIAPLLSGWTGVMATHPLVLKYGKLPPEIVIVGSGPFPECRHADRLRRSGVSTIISVYSSAENTCCVAAGIWEGRRERCGKVLPGIDIQVLDSKNDRVLPPGSMGEICIRGPQVVEARLNPHLVDSHVLDLNGWLKTGDIGNVDGDGYLTIDGRADDVISIKGQKVCLRQLEDLICRHPAVYETAIIGSPSIKALVVKKRGYPEVTEKELSSFANTLLPDNIQIDTVDFVHQLPKSTCGRLVRRAVQEQHTVRRSSTDRMP